MCSTNGKQRNWKIAVASSDGANVDLHLGKSDEFLIFSLDTTGTFLLSERRRASPNATRTPHGADLPAALKGIDVVLASQAGPTAIEALQAHGIRVLTVRGPIPRALQAFAKRGWILLENHPTEIRRGLRPAGGGCRPPGGDHGEGGGCCGDGGACA